MVFPSTQLAGLCLLLFSVFCLGLWPLAYQASGERHRFEIFSFDFALGAIVLALAAAYTLGTMGSELGFSDTMLVAGRRAQVMAFCAGALFAVGNMLFVCTISLLALSRAILICGSVASVVFTALAMTRANFVTLFPAACLFFMVMCLAALASRSRNAVKPALKKGAPMTADSKGAITGIISGLCLGGVLPVLRLAQMDELSIGPYGGMLMAAIGISVATPALNFYFMNLAIAGESLGLAAYRTGPVKNRLFGFIGGLVWCAGALALYVVVTSPKPVDVSSTLCWSALFASVLLTFLCGIFTRGQNRKLLLAAFLKLLLAAFLLFICGTVLFLSATEHSTPW